MNIVYFLPILLVSMLLLPSAYSTSNFAVRSNNIIKVHGTLDCLWHRVYSEDVVEARATAFIEDHQKQSHIQTLFHNFTMPKKTWSFLFCADSQDNNGKYNIASARVLWEKLE